MRRQDWRYTDNELLRFIKDKSIELGRTPKIAEIEQYSEIVKRFGSWDEALNKLGLTKYKSYNSSKNKGITNEMLIEELKKLGEQLGRIPVYSDVKNYRLYDSRFGTWGNALRIAGFNKEISPNHYASDEEIIELYRKLCKKLNRTATVSDIDNDDSIKISSVTFYRRFGSINRLREIVGVEKVYNKNDKHNEEKLAETLIELKNKYQRNLTRQEIINERTEYSLPHHQTLYKIFNVKTIKDLWKKIDDYK